MSPPNHAAVKPRECPTSKIDRALFLPPSFELIPRLLLHLDNPEGGDAEELAEVVRADTALSADILRISNSAYFSGGYRVETVRDAILRMGLREVYRIVMRIVASPMFQASQKTSLARVELWKHSFAAAVAAHLLAGMTGEDAEVAFTTALLHDVGKLVLAQAHGVKYTALVEESMLENRGTSRLEKNAFHVDHATLGARLLQQWHFPERISAVVGAHHEPLRALRPYVKLAAITYTANILAYRIGRGFGFPEYVVNPDHGVLRILDLSATDFDGLQEEVADALEKEESRFR